MTFPIMPFSPPGYDVSTALSVIFCGGYGGIPTTNSDYSISASTPNADRYVVFSIGSLSSTTLLGATVNEVGGTPVSAEAFSVGGYSHYIIAKFPTGSIVRVNASWSSFPAGGSLTSVYSVNNISNVIPISSGHAEGINSVSIPLNTQAGGAIFATDAASGSGLSTSGGFSPEMIVTASRIPTGSSILLSSYKLNSASGTYNLAAYGSSRPGSTNVYAGAISIR